jgi:hypothetical protein
MNYSNMTMDEINETVKRGGDKLLKLNKMVSNHLDGLKLSQEARNIIAETDGRCIAEVFGGLFTAEDVERFINDNY